MSIHPLRNASSPSTPVPANTIRPADTKRRADRIGPAERESFQEGYAGLKDSPLKTTLKLLERRSLPEKMGERLQNRASTLALVGRLSGLLAAPSLFGLLARGVGSAQSLPDWLHNRAPVAFNKALELVVDRASEPVEKSLGLALPELFQVEKFLFQALAPERTDQGVESSRMIHSLNSHSATSINPSGAPLVYLGPGREQEAAEITRRFTTLTAPPQDASEEMLPVWKSLFDKAGRGDWPVYFDLDGDLSQVNATEAIVNEAAGSLLSRKNTLGSGGGVDPRLFLQSLQVRAESNARYFEPWLQQKRPRVHSCVQALKADLKPTWLKADSQDLLGWRVRPEDRLQAFERFMGLSKSCYAGGLADAVVALNNDLVSGVQSFWIKFLRELTLEQRGQVLEEVARAWVLLNTQRPSQQDPLVSMGKSAENLSFARLDPATGQWHNQDYEPGAALTEVIDQTLNGLGIKERQQFVGALRQALRARLPELEAREKDLRNRYGAFYQGLDVKMLLEGEAGRQELDVMTPLAELESIEKSMQGELPGKDWAIRRGEVARHRALMDWLAGLEDRYGEVRFVRPAGLKGAVAASEFFAGSVVRPGVAPAPLRPEILGTPDGSPPQKVSLVLEGGGGKGFCYPECLSQLKQALSRRTGQVALDEYVGTSAGAITAGLLAAGFEGQELAEVMGRLDFKKFNSDFIWLQGGHDPKVRGINRTGMFSMQQMYQTLSDLIGRKLGISGRPVTFQDLPTNLKILGTVLNTDLPESHPLRKQIGPDGQLLFSRETTPHFDVVGCILASAAVPMFFNAPQLQICDDDGRLYRMQLVDGGVVNNLAISEAGQKDEKSALMMLPAYYEADEDVRLTTLSFESVGPAIDEMNRESYRNFGANLGKFVEALESENFNRAVIALNLTSQAEQPLPLVQGRSRSESQDLTRLAEECQFPVLDSQQAARVVESHFQSPGLKGKLLPLLLDAALDGKGERDFLRPSFLGSPTYRPGQQEAGDLWEVLTAVLAATEAAKGQCTAKRFES